jgi:hypothetical protein
MSLIELLCSCSGDYAMVSRKTNAECKLLNSSPKSADVTALFTDGTRLAYRFHELLKLTERERFD